MFIQELAVNINNFQEIHRNKFKHSHGGGGGVRHGDISIVFNGPN